MSVNDFLANFNSGVRPNLYQVYIDNLPEKLKFMCKATSMPGKDIPAIDVFYMDKIIPIPGDVTFPEWMTTVMLDSDWAVRKEIEDWMERIRPNSEIGGEANLRNIYGTATVGQLGLNNQIIAEYKLHNIFPSSLQPIELSFETRDTVAQFDITWRYTHWEKVR